MKVLYVLVLLLCSMTYINGQICSERVLMTKFVPQTYSLYVTESYLGRCFYRCVRTRLRVVQNVRPMPKTVAQIKKICCDGYLTNTTSSILQCDPICIPACENGYCSQPGVCKCNEGYSPSSYIRHRCIPICTKKCDHGTCVGPDLCQCDFGYQLVNDTCVPICNNPCVNGMCAAPDTCVCLPGYRQTSNETCYPYCSNCAHGTCISPENCVCDSGWHKKEPDSMCEPLCVQDCGHGTCITPNTCECLDRYIKNENGTCVPFCSSGCPHGSCISPENCSCDYGWSKTELGICEPQCENGCKNGICVSPNLCECLAGYKKSENGSCVPHCPSGCSHGTCVSPDFCECDSGWSKNATECEPICDYECGNGTCIAPNVCQCFPGYEHNVHSVLDVSGSFQDKIVFCSPKCHNCYGKCVAPNQCVCDPPLIAEHAAADGDGCDCFEDCLEDSKICDRTVCITDWKTVTVSTESTEDLLSTYDIDITFGDDVATRSSTLNEETTESFFNEATDLASMVNSDDTRLPDWIYITAAAVLISVIAIVITVIVKRKAIKDYFHSGDYYVEGDKEGEYNKDLSMEEVKYSDLLKNNATV